MSIPANTLRRDVSHAHAHTRMCVRVRGSMWAKIVFRFQHCRPMSARFFFPVCRGWFFSTWPHKKRWDIRQPPFYRSRATQGKQSATYLQSGCVASSTITNIDVVVADTGLRSTVKALFENHCIFKVRIALKRFFFALYVSPICLKKIMYRLFVTIGIT